MNTTPLIPAGYADWLAAIKKEIAQARSRAALAVNAELVQLYGRIGQEIVQRQAEQGWGTRVIDRLASDLKESFPDMRGWSSSNLKYMRFFAEHCPKGQFGQQPADQLPWFHIVTLLTKLDDEAGREWYATQAVTNGWSRSTLELNIKNQLRQRQGAAVTNFARRLPAADSALARDTLKDPYLFDFLGLGNEAHEREIEDGLVRHITRFLLELGAGFAFVGKQYRLEVAGDEFFIDLLFSVESKAFLESLDLVFVFLFIPTKRFYKSINICFNLVLDILNLSLVRSILLLSVNNQGSLVGV